MWRTDRWMELLSCNGLWYNSFRLIFSPVEATLSVSLSVGWSVAHAVEIFAENLFKRYCCPCPPDATDAVVFKALLYFERGLGA